MLAVVLGLLIPILETVRRWGTFGKNPVTVIEDYVIGALLLWGAWLVGRNYRRGGGGAGGGPAARPRPRPVGQLYHLQTGEADPAPVSSEAVAVIKGALLALAIVALAVTVLAKEANEPEA